MNIKAARRRRITPCLRRRLGWWVLADVVDGVSLSICRIAGRRGFGILVTTKIRSRFTLFVTSSLLATLTVILFVVSMLILLMTIVSLGSFFILLFL